MDSLASAERHIQIAERKLQKAREKNRKLEEERAALTFRMSKKHIAEYLGCSRTTVWRKMKDGKIKSQKAIHVIEFKTSKG